MRKKPMPVHTVRSDTKSWGRGGARVRVRGPMSSRLNTLRLHLKLQQGVVQHNGNGIVEDTLAKYKGVQSAVDAEVLKHCQHCHRICQM